MPKQNSIYRQMSFVIITHDMYTPTLSGPDTCIKKNTKKIKFVSFSLGAKKFL